MTTVAGMTGVSRIVGFIRDMLMAAYLGAGPVADAFFVALKLPNFFRRVTAEGAFSIAFVPLYSKTIEIENKEKADLFASNAFMVMLSLLSVVTLLAIAFMPYVIQLIAPGFSSNSQQFELAVEFSRITFPYLLLMSLTALLGGVLNALNRFAPFAFAPVLFNLALIFSLFVSNRFETIGHALALGVLLAGVLQLIFLLFSVFRAGFYLKVSIPRIDADIRKVLKLMGPAVIGAGVIHINLFADLIIASFLEEGSISYLYYADRLNQLPLGVVGIAVGTALLPMLSKAMAKQDHVESKKLFSKAMEYCLLFALPASIALMVMPVSLVTVLFERGAFDMADTAVTANVLSAYALGLPAYITVKVFSTAHWAREDTITPVKISVVATIVNIVLSIIFIQYIGVVGIALGTGLSGWLQFIMHIQALKNHPSAQLEKQTITKMLKIFGCSCIMGACLSILASLLISFTISGSVLVQILSLGSIIVTGMLIYGICITFTGVANLQQVRKVLKKSE